MRQLTFVEPGRVEWWDVPDPVIQSDDDACVRPLAVARCDLDLYIARGLYPMRPPFPLGHESVGEVIAVGDRVRRVRPGDRVIVPFQVSCGACTACRRGHTNACEAVPAGSAFGLGPHGGVDFGGALSDAMRVPFADAMLVPLPDDVSPEIGAGLSDNVADGYRTVAPHLEAEPRAPVLVAGGLAQSVGLYAAHAAKALGSERVVYADFDADRLGLAASLGVETLRIEYAADTPAAGSFPITVDASALPFGLQFALRSTRPCGVCTGVSGGLGPTAELPLQSMYLKGIRYDVGRVHGRATLEPVLGEVRAGRLAPERLFTRTVAFDTAAEAIFDPGTKIVFVPGA